MENLKNIEKSGWKVNHFFGIFWSFIGINKNK
jgi:hypothetical protein